MNRMTGLIAAALLAEQAGGADQALLLEGGALGVGVGRLVAELPVRVGQAAAGC